MRTAAEKILKYLQERKRPVTVAQISEHFLLPTSTVRKVLHELKSKDFADFESAPDKKGRALQRWYYRRPLALPPVSAPAAPPTPRPSAPRKWTVYDDRAYD